MWWYKRDVIDMVPGERASVHLEDHGLIKVAKRPEHDSVMALDLLAR